MSRTFDVLCHECRVRLWVAQDHASRREAFYIYGGNRAFPRAEEMHSPLAEFLFRHQGHSLGFKQSDLTTDSEDDYTKLDDVPGLPPEPTD